MTRYSDTLRNVKGNYCFLLFNEDAYLLDSKANTGKTKGMQEFKEFFIPGVSFCDRSVGTNFFTLAKTLKMTVHMYPDFHYCNKLKSWYEYCTPITRDNNIAGYVCVVGFQHPIPKALEGFTDLLAINIYDEHSVKGSRHIDYDRTKIELTSGQRQIIKMIAQGLTDEHIARELKLSLSTVKYHNHTIFSKLNASSRVDAVIKAIMLNEISLADLYSFYL